MILRPEYDDYYDDYYEEDCPPLRFEYQGKPNSNNKANNVSGGQSNQTKQQSSAKETKESKQAKKEAPRNDLTIREDHTPAQLEELIKKYKSSMTISQKPNTKGADNKNPSSTRVNHLSTGAPSSSSTSSPAAGSKTSSTVRSTSLTSKAAAKRLKPVPLLPKPSKPLVSLQEKRQMFNKQSDKTLIANNQPAPPPKQPSETVKKRALKTSEEYKEFTKNSRPRVNLVVVGHVDAGKSTLVGHLLYNIGQISGKQMHRYEVDSQRSGKSSFKFAWAMDETDQERARGVTIDIALTQFSTPHRDVVLLDAPGHVDFIPAVISGAAQADAALLVVDATRGEFETGFGPGGQTREHTFLVRSLGVKSLIVIVNKMDAVDWNWSRFADIVDQLKPFLRQVGFNLKDDVQFIACSGLTGENISERRIDKVKRESSHPQLEGEGGNWGDLPSLLEAIDKISEPERMVDKPTRVCVTDVFKGMSSGVFLGGKVVSGKIEAKQKLILLPPNETCDIKQVENRDTKANKAFAGDIVTTTATGVDLNKYYRGCMLCDPQMPCHVTNRFQARIVMFQGIDTILIKGTPIEVHINGTYESGTVRKLISLLNKNTGELIHRKPRCIVKNSSAIIQLKLSRVVCCELYEDNKDLGRFLMRSYGKTIAAGLITKIKKAKVERSGGTKLKTK